MPSLSSAQSPALERPFVLSELKAAIAAAAKSKSPGLDSLSYELYVVVIDLVGPRLLQSFNAMLRIGAAIGHFLWAGRLEHLALDELHSPLHRGGLGLTCVATRTEALRFKLACHQLEARGQPRLHLAYWLGHPATSPPCSRCRPPHRGPCWRPLTLTVWRWRPWGCHFCQPLQRTY
jgi:hypothetical protein